MLDVNIMIAQTLIQRLRAKGLRLTKQRRLILEALQYAPHHMRADAIADAITARHPSSSLDMATIYRTLRSLSEVGIVGETGLGEGCMVYVLLSKHNDHHHLVCDHCRQVTQVSHDVFEPVRLKLAQQYGFAARLDHMAVFGRCATCQQEQQEREVSG